MGRRYQNLASNWSAPFLGAAIPRQEYGLGARDDVDFKSKSLAPIAQQRWLGRPPPLLGPLRSPRQPNFQGHAGPGRTTPTPPA